MDLGENEWLTDIQTQTRRLAELTNDLILLSRMEEDRAPVAMIDFPHLGSGRGDGALLPGPGPYSGKDLHQPDRADALLQGR